MYSGILQCQAGHKGHMAAGPPQPLNPPPFRSVVNILPQASYSCSMDGVPAISLDYNEEEEEESFHKFHHCRTMLCSPVSQCKDPMWQTAKWLQTCKEGVDDAEKKLMAAC